MPQKIRWHLEADVVVIGCGAAGAIAAITAHDCGSEVLILEKQDSEDPISTSFMSGGVILCPSDIEGATHYMVSLYRVSENLFWTDPDVIRAWAKYTTENKKWVESIGGTMRFIHRGGEHKLPGTESIDVYRIRGMGPRLMKLLYDQVSSRAIRVIHSTPASELLFNHKGEVIGVRGMRMSAQGRGMNVRARRGVILATGGFEFDEQMKLQYLKVYPSYFLGSPANTGDGIRLGLGAGAQLWHMNCCSGRFIMKFAQFPFGFNAAFGGKAIRSPTWEAPQVFAGTEKKRRHINERAPVAGYIVVDRSGRRYTNENYKAHTLYYELSLFDSERLFYPRIPSFWIFDQKRMGNGSLVMRHSGPAGPARLYSWSSDNSVELTRGWIKQGDTPRELALKVGLDDRILENTIRNYNLYCRRGKDPECDREPITLIPLTTPPYYAVDLWPGGPNTQGGPRRNSKANVLRSDGSEIPRLYSAGELGSIYGMLYPSGGGNLAECIAFGRIAGENASKNRPL